MPRLRTLHDVRIGGIGPADGADTRDTEWEYGVVVSRAAGIADSQPEHEVTDAGNHYM